MNIANQNCQLVKVDSAILAPVIAHPEDYSNLVVTATINCCNEVYTASIPLHGETVDCTDCTGVRWTIDLTNVAQLNRSVLGITILNSISGQVYTITTDISWDTFLTACPTANCTIQSVDPYYTDAFYDALNTWFSTTLGWNDVQTTFCGNQLIVCGLPEHFIPNTILFNDTLSNPQSQVFTFNGSAVAFISGSSLYLSPTFFASTKLIDGIYSITFEATTTDGSKAEDTGCYFIDCVTRCKVAQTIHNYLEDIDKGITDSPFVNVHMVHYALTTDGNCSCNCNDMCSLFSHLQLLLDNIQTSPCGC